MTEKRTSIFENGLIWFGAGVSLAESYWNLFCPTWLPKRASCYYYWTHYRLHHAFPGRCNRRKNTPQCYGNCKNELRGKRAESSFPS